MSPRYVLVFQAPPPSLFLSLSLSPSPPLKILWRFFRYDISFVSNLCYMTHQFHFTLFYYVCSNTTFYCFLPFRQKYICITFYFKRRGTLVRFISSPYSGVVSCYDTLSVRVSLCPTPYRFIHFAWQQRYW